MYIILKVLTVVELPLIPLCAEYPLRPENRSNELRLSDDNLLDVD